MRCTISTDAKQEYWKTDGQQMGARVKYTQLHSNNTPYDMCCLQLVLPLLFDHRRSGDSDDEVSSKCVEKLETTTPFQWVISIEGPSSMIPCRLVLMKIGQRLERNGGHIVRWVSFR